MAAPAPVMQRAVRDWFLAEMGAEANLRWKRHDLGGIGGNYWTVEIDPFLDLAMPFCPFEYGAIHFKYEQRRSGGLPKGFLQEANKVLGRFDRMLAELGWRESAFGEPGRCVLNFFSNDREELARTPVWGGSAYWAENEPFVTVIALERKVLVARLGEAIKEEAQEAVDLDGEFDTVEQAEAHIYAQDDRYELGQLVHGLKVAGTYETLITEGFVVLDV